MIEALTPEELDTLLEDAFVVRDAEALAGLFEADALVATGEAAPVRGSAIAPVIGGLWERGATYLAQSRRVLQAGDTALVVGAHAISVVRRGDGGGWRYAITLIDIHQEEASA